MDQLLLWISMAFVVFLAARRRDNAKFPLVGMALCVVGIAGLVLNAMRDWFGGNGWNLLINEIGGLITGWQLIEVASLVTVGVGLIMMTLVADSERQGRQRGAAARRVANSPNVSVVMSVLNAAPGATLMLRRDEGNTNAFKVLYADEVAAALLRLPSSRTNWLHQAATQTLAGQIAIAANAAMSARSLERSEHPVNESWFEIAAGAHADGVLVMLTDITERKRAEQALTRVAYTDPVTGLANRALLEREMDEGVKWASENPRHQFAVLCLDFDDFKGVNDRYGHDAGDALLVSIGTRISSLLNEEFGNDADRFVAARWGGDEFVVLLKQVNPEQVVMFGKRLCDHLASPHKFNGITITSTASVGAAMYTEGQTKGSDVLKEADSAMYVAKHAGKNRIQVAWETGGEPLPFPASEDARDPKAA